MDSKPGDFLKCFKASAAVRNRVPSMYPAYFFAETPTRAAMIRIASSRVFGSFRKATPSYHAAITFCHSARCFIRLSVETASVS